MIEIIKLIPFSTIPWPTFLIYYIGLVIGCIILGWLFVNADGSTAYPLPSLARFKSTDIAALRGGSAEVIHTVVFSLWRRNLINIEGEGRDTEIESMSSKKSVLSPIEKLIHQYALTKRQIRYLLDSTGLRSQVERQLEPLYIEFEDLHLIRTHRDQLRASITAITLSLVIIAVGGAKVYLKIFHDRSWVLLFIIILISIMILISVLKPGKMAATRLGRRYLKALEENFGWVQQSLKRGITPEGIDPAFSIAVFGIGALAGVSAYSHFTQAFRAPKSGGFSGGCGGCGG